MTDYGSIWSAASQLPQQDRLRLIYELWDTLPADADPPFSQEWATEIHARVAEFKSGRVQTIRWEQVRSEALARIQNAQHG